MVDNNKRHIYNLMQLISFIPETILWLNNRRITTGQQRTSAVCIFKK